VSRDPLGYVDGMSLYRGYFAIDRTDPTGRYRIAGSNSQDEKVEEKVENVISCGDRSVFTKFPNPKGGPPPLYRDPALDPWYAGPNKPNARHILALNHMCFRVDWQCDNDGKAIFNGIEFELFMTIPTDMPHAEFLARIYGHEMQHLAKMLSYLQELLQIVNEDSWCNFGQDCVDCEEFGERLEVFNKALWRQLGPCFRHGIPGGPGWGEFVDPTWNGKDIDVPANEDIPTRPSWPRHGADGWFCSMDQVLAQKRLFPDWEFPDWEFPDEAGPPPFPHPTPVR
jgi:hypothetical protein